ncbi:conserved protein of unknown function [Sterolibacterium denitrificans]|uniref:Sulfotransferase n=1 Tax=Sterolibacterium denitrificans TaxID=157592 RepID=A0A7Z7HP72_9PROT|nr:sulfotransferase [Sterolibacterium denitrificans]SMB21935.1 conserved protein of unknown function [Sterolibacterium denitrificans]
MSREIAASLRQGGRWASREQEFHEIAIRMCDGYDDFGETSYLEGLRRLLYSYDEEARFHTLGALTMRYQLVGLLAERLRTNRWFAAMPESAEIRIERPLVITGMVRTGSSALLDLMGANPDTQCLPYWLGLHPQPRPPRAQWEAAYDFQHARVELDLMYRAGRNVLEAIHFLSPDGPDEPGRIIGQGFSDDRFEVVNTVPTWSEWYANTIHRETFQRYRRVTQLIGAYEPDKRWLMKYPVFIRNLEAFLDAFPDACILWTHRDPAQVLPSYVSLVAHFRGLMEKDIDHARIAREQLEIWASAMECGMRLREGREHQFHDVYFNDFYADPLGEIARAYARFDQSFPEAARAAIQKWRDDNPPGKHGEHTYSKTFVGVDRAAIHARFAAYLARFPRVLEKRNKT